MKQMKKRITEIDFFRGIAILMMVYVHIVFDLKNYYSVPVPAVFTQSAWSISTAFIFVLVSGISACFGKNTFFHGVRIFGLALLLSAVTYFIAPSDFIVFGILHCLGACLMLSPIFLKRSPFTLLIVAILILTLGNVFLRISTNVPHLYWLGLMEKDFTSIDYYPLLPWLSVFLLGICIGKTAYRQKENRLIHPKNQNFLCVMGRHSLIIYFIHQPLILLLLFFFSRLITVLS